jgi:hypothetical protein
MYKSGIFRLIVLFGVVGIVLFGIGRNGTVLSDGEHSIHLKSRTFTPLEGVDLHEDEPNGTGYGIVQFYAVPSAESRVNYEKAGLILHSYIPENSWLATFPTDLTVLDRFSDIRWLGALNSADKIDAAFYAVINQAPDVQHAVWVTFFPGVAALEARDHLFDSAEKVSLDNSFQTTLTAAQLDMLLATDSVMWVAPAPGTPEALNDGIRGAVNADAVQALPYGLDGEGMQVAVFDTGLIDDAHPDLVSTVVYSSGAAISHHATHVAGILAGSGANSELYGGSAGQWGGIAPGVDLISYQLADPVAPHNEAINVYGADVSQNSWGITTCQLLGEYEGYSWSYDSITIGYFDRPISVVFAAGNQRFACGQTYGTILGGPQTAKNVLTIGGVNDDGTHTGSSSGWGPTLDGRLKPELVAPGVGIRSTVPGGGYGGYTGSSQAAPAISGGIAILQQQYQRVCDGEPDDNALMLPATIRAILTHSATDLAATGPDYETGYGMMNLERAVKFVPDHVEATIGHGQELVYSTVVEPDQSELRFTLAWDDLPVAYVISAVLINDLDLELEAPDGTIYGSWVLDPTAGNEANPAQRPVWANGDFPVRDNLNVIEQVLVDAPMPGVWQVRVRGSQVPMGPQTFSLVGSGLNASSCNYLDQPAIITVINPEENNVLEGEVPVIVTALDIEDQGEGLQVEMAVADGDWEQLGSESDTDQYSAMMDASALEPGITDLVVRVTDSAENQVVSSVLIIVGGSPTSIQLDRVHAQQTIDSVPYLLLALLTVVTSVIVVQQRRKPQHI